LFRGEKGLFIGEKALFIGEKSFHRGEQGLFRGEKAFLKGERRLFGGERRAGAGATTVFHGARAFVLNAGEKTDKAPMFFSPLSQTLSPLISFPPPEPGLFLWQGEFRTPGSGRVWLEGRSRRRDRVPAAPALVWKPAVLTGQSPSSAEGSA
jgi:hypothetical protein